MKVAFDVQGTLFGQGQNRVLKLFQWFKDKGCEMHVWSFGGLMMAKDAIVKLGLQPARPLDKYGEFDDEVNYLGMMDIAIDDCPGDKDILATKHMISVYDIPDNPDDFEAAFGHLLTTEEKE